MAVPSSGELELRGDIALEVYGNATGTNISLGTMSDLAGFSSPDAMTDFYGYSGSAAPSVTTNNMSNIQDVRVTLNANVTSDGGATITERGFYFGTNSASPTNNTKYTVSGKTGAYSNTRTGLNQTTTYYSWAFATNASGTTYGSRVQATTVATFNATFAAIGFGSYGKTYTENAQGTPALHESYYTLYYINPVTGSGITLASASATSGIVGHTKQYYMRDYNSGLACTNARNYIRLQTKITPNDGDYSFLSRNWTIDVRSDSGRQLSNPVKTDYGTGGSIQVNNSSQVIYYKPNSYDSDPNLKTVTLAVTYS